MMILSWILMFASVLLGLYGFYMSDKGLIPQYAVWVNSIVVILLFVSAIMIQKREADVEERGADDDDR